MFLKPFKKLAARGLLGLKMRIVVLNLIKHLVFLKNIT